jgi:RNA polymerase sigma factor (sigma-70 family)
MAKRNQTNKPLTDSASDSPERLRLRPLQDVTVMTKSEKEVIWHRVERSVRMTCKARVHQDDVEDAVAETFIRVWLHIETLKTSQYPKAYAEKIAHHVCMDILNKKSKAPVVIDADQFCVEFDFERYLERYDMNLLLSKLTASDRKLIELVFLRGIAPNEVFSHWPAETPRPKRKDVQGALRSALTRLKSILETSQEARPSRDQALDILHASQTGISTRNVKQEHGRPSLPDRHSLDHDPASISSAFACTRLVQKLASDTSRNWHSHDSLKSYASVSTYLLDKIDFFSLTKHLDITCRRMLLCVSAGFSRSGAVVCSA